MNLLIRLPNWLGDVVMSLSAVESIHRAGRYELHALVRPPWTELFLHDPRFKSVIPCDDSSANLFRLSREIHARQFDAVVDFTHSARSFLLWKLSRIPRVHREQRQNRDVHQSLRYLSIIRDLVPAPAGLPLPASLFPPPSSVSLAKEDPPVDVLLFPSAAYGPAKMWSASQYRALITDLLSRGLSVCLVGTPRDHSFLSSLAASSAVKISTDLSLPSLMHLISSSTAVIACDSGPAHLAAALGKPVLVLFFSTDPARTAPVGPAVRVVTAEVPCRPCFLRECPIGYLCRDSLTIPNILTHIDDILDLPPPQLTRLTTN